MMCKKALRMVGLLAGLAMSSVAAAQSDLCSGATPVGLGSFPFDNTGFGNEGRSPVPGTCAFFGNSPTGDLYFSFTAPSAGTYVFTTCGTGVGSIDDTIIELYASCADVAAFGPVIACNDDGGGTNCGPFGYLSRVITTLAASQTVIVRVMGWDAFQVGTGTLTISGGTPPPANDLCANAIAVGLGSTAFDTTLANNEATTDCGGLGPDIFYTFTPATSGGYRIDTCGSSFDTTLSIKTSCSATEITCSDNVDCGSGFTFQSAIQVCLTGGVTYTIQVDGFGGSSGPGVLNISTTSIPLSIDGAFSTGPELSTVLVGAFVTPACNSTGIVARADLSSIGGSSTQLLYDDGTNGDPVAGDNVYIYEYTLPITVQSGTYDYPISVTDMQGGSDTDTSTLGVFDGPSGACCVGSSCNIARQTTCFAASGTWQGNGSNCGGDSYQSTPGSSTFTSIAGTGTLLTAISNCDDCVQDLALPFAYNFFGLPVTNVSISSNGNIQFVAPGTGSWEYVNTPIPSTGFPNNAVYPAWDDYNPLVQGDVYYVVTGTSPNRVLTISWENVTEFFTINSNSFQVSISESSPQIIVAYGAMANLPEAFPGDVTIGIENATGDVAGVQNAATTSGNSSNVWIPIIVPGPCGPTCDGIDFNNDGLFPDTQDLDDFLSVFGGGPCSTDPTPGCNDLDFNNDGLFPDTLDIDSFLSVFGGGPCL